VVLTASSGFDQDKLHVLSFDAKDGSLQWERMFAATGRTSHHPKTCVAAPTPACDGKRIFAFYSCNDVFCLDLSGRLLWTRGLTLENPQAGNSLGMSSSPVVADDTLIVQVENDSHSLAFGLSVEDGTDRWRHERPRKANWTSAAVYRNENGPLALLQSSRGVTAVKPRTGEVVWNYDDGASTVPSSATGDGTIYIPSHGITAVDGGGPSAVPEQRWRSGKLNPGTASPIYYRKQLYIINSAGVLTGADPKDGEVKSQTRLSGPFSGSPVAAGGKIYIFNEKGTGIVVDVAGEKPEIVGQNDLDETILCTPAVAGGGLYVRSDLHLYKIAE
jgi:outer membrane protein assembly factor BamB